MRGKSLWNILLLTFRIILGLVFVFSGFVKGIDPLGTAYKLTDYFNAFHIGFLSPLALAFSIILNMSEFVLGVALMLGIFPRFFTYMAIVYMAIFTPITFVLAIYNPVTDCGCFGDAIVMTNWQTFFKNVILVALLVPLFIFRKNIRPILWLNGQWTALFISVLIFLTLSWYNYQHLPMIDFRPYKVGNYIPDGMHVPEGMPVDSFSYSIVYQKEEIIREFNLDEIPTDTAWKWVETKSELVRKGYHPPIHDFSFTSKHGNDVTDSILYDTSYVFLAISHRIEKAARKGLEELKNIYEYSKNKGFAFYLATASTSDLINTYKEEMALPFSFYTADDIMLKTVVRSNPGLVLIKNGTIIDKWHYNDLPTVEELNRTYNLYDATIH